MTRSIHLALFLALALVLSACSGDGSEDSTGIAEVTAEAGETVSSAPGDSPETTAAATADDSDSIRDIDLDPRLRGLEVALNGTAEAVNENTVRMTFDDGSVDGTGAFRACITAKSILDEGMTLIVAYPDGEKTCE